MLLNRLSRLQSLLPAWAASRFSSVEQRALKTSGRASNRVKRTPSAHTISLFEELFPEEVKASEREAKAQKHKTTSPGPLRDDFLREFEWAKSEKYRPSGNGNPEAQNESTGNMKLDEQEIKQRQNASVLVLTNASKNLSLSDFLRLSPKGQHIDGWASGIMKVIPGRDPQTLEPQGHYFILFSNDDAARAYMDRIVRLHRISKTWTPTSITSALPPPPGYLKDGEDLHGLMQAFTLIPSSQQNVSIRKLKKPLRPAMQRMIAEGGHPSIAARQSKSEDMVLFSLDKSYVGIYELRAVLGRDGKERNLQWNLLPGDDDIVKLDGIKVDTTEAEVEEQEIKGRKRRQTSRFIISFKDQQEARRFVMAWHRRPFLLAQERHPEDEAPPIVSAELLW